MGGKTATTQQTVQIPREVMERYTSVNKRAEQAASQPFQAYSSDPNAFVAPLTGAQQAGIQNIGQAQNLAQPYYQAGAGLTLGGAQGVGPLTQQQIGYYQNPYTQAVAGTTFDALRQQQQQEMQGATANAIRSGAFGGDRAGLVAANLARQQKLGTAQALAPIFERGYQQAVQTGMGQQQIMGQDLQRQLAAGQQIAGLGTGATQTALQAGQALLGAGTAEQQTGQAGLSALYNQFQQERGYPFQVAQFLANIAMGTGALSGSTTTTQQPVPFFSDEREKTNIQPLGKGLYAYDYIDDVRAAERGDRPMPPKRVGPMAQEIEERAPGLVGEVNGRKVVNPDRAGYADGGMPDFAGNLRQLYAQFGMPEGGLAAAMHGGPYGAKIAAPPPAQLKTAGAPPPRPGSVVGDAMKNIEGVRDFGKTASEMYEGAEKGFGKLKSIFYADGGEVDKDDPMKDYGGDMGIPTEMPDVKPLEPAKPPPPPGSVMGDIIGLGKMAASFLPFSSGGLVPRMGYADGGMPDEDYAIRTIAAEMGGKSPEEARAIAHVIENRRASGRWGDTYGDVVRAPSQFEPWSNPQAKNYPLNYAPDSPQYQMARDAFQAARSGEDVTGGAMHFYAPAAQEQLSRTRGDRAAVPSWARDREYTDFGPTRIVRGVDSPSRAMAYAGEQPRSEALGAIEKAAGEGRRMDQPEEKGLMSMLPTKRDPRTGEKETNWKQILIPALSGLGAMASSNSLYAGSAILQGLGAGAKSYADLERQQADVGKVEAETFETAQRAANLSTRQVGNVTMVRLANGQEVPIWEWIRSRQPVLGGQLGMAAAESAANRYMQAEGGEKLATVPSGGVKAGDLSPVQGVQAPEAPSIFGKRSEALASKDVESTLGPNPEAAKKVSADYAAGASAGGNAAREASPTMNEMVINVSKTVSGKGFDAPGAAYAARAQLAGAANTIARAFGYTGPSFSMADERQALQEKFNNVQALAMARGGGQESLGALQSMIEALPRTDMPPDAQAQIAAQLLMLNQKAKDRDRHRIMYGDKSMQSFTAAGTAFADDNPDSRYIQEMDLLKNAVRNDPKAIEILTSGRATPAQIEEYFKTLAKKVGKPYISGISRYFLEAGAQ